MLYLCENNDAAKTVAIVEQEGRMAIAIAGDVGDLKSCKKAIAKVVNSFGRIDILVNNAGEQHPDQDITDINEAQLAVSSRTISLACFSLPKPQARI